MRFSIAPAGPGRLAVTGELDFETASEALRSGSAALNEAHGNWTVDLGGVTAGDSAGVAVLVEWLSVALARGTTLRYESVPAQMISIARISGLEDVLFPQSGPEASGTGSSGSSPSSSP